MRSRLHRRFEEVGWVVEDINKDYGEDLLVRVFERGKGTPFKFFVQAKATENVSRYLNSKENIFYFPLRKSHVRHWCSLNDPVILTLWDARSDEIYWVNIQKAFRDRRQQNGSKHYTLRAFVPCDQTLNARGIQRIKSIAKAFHIRPQQDRLAIEALIRFIKSETGTEVDYSRNNEFLLFRMPDGKAEVLLLGEFDRQARRRAAKLGKSLDQAMTEALDVVFDGFDEWEKTGLFAVLNPETRVVEKRKMTIEELRHYISTEQFDY